MSKTSRTPIPWALVATILILFSGFADGADQTTPTQESCWPGEPGSPPEDCPPNDPKYGRHWEFLSRIPTGIDLEGMHPREVALGSIGFSLDRAWQHELGRDDVVIAVLDSGIRWNSADLSNKLFLNRGELPLPTGAETYDANGDGVFDIRDYSADPAVGDSNGNGRLDPGDLILVFSNGKDDDRNGYPDDICGYDFFGFDGPTNAADGDNDPADDTDFGHGTGIASTAAAETGNALGDVGVCPRCRVLPVRVGDSFVVDANRFARGVAFATHAGAAVIGAALGSYNNPPAARAAIDLAYHAGVPVIVSAADEFAYHHNYPAVHNHTIYVNAIRYNHASDWRRGTTFWGVSPCTNYGARVSLSVPATTCSSGATARLAGIAGLVVSAARNAGANLSAEEVYQLLQTTADDLDNSEPDWGALRYPARKGFDQFYGNGRVNALRAVTAASAKRIPPEADLETPRWFAVISPRHSPTLEVRASMRARHAEHATYRLDWAPGVEPTEAEYRGVASGRFVSERRGPIARLDLGTFDLPDKPAPRNRNERDRYSVTLRLSVSDDRGLTAEARRSFFLIDDADWATGFPIDLDASGEATPVLIDLDGDGADEIVLPTADGLLNIFSHRDGALRRDRYPLDIAGTIGTGEPFRESAVRGAAVGDLDGDRSLEIVVASREGKVYAFSAQGERRAGFPVAIDRARGRGASPERIVESGILSRPVLADLDGHPGLEIVVSAMDGHLYVWRADGKPLAGFPVALASRRSISTPAVGDLDGDGSPDIVVGSNAGRDELGFAFAVRATGNTHPNGPMLPGWNPFGLAATRPGLLPTLASGISMDPVLVDVDGDGDDEAVLYAATGPTITLVDQPADGPARVFAELSMVPDDAAAISGLTYLAGIGSPWIGDTDGDGTQELYAPLIPLRILTMRAKPGVPLDLPLALGGWDLPATADGSRARMISAWPRRMEDLMIGARPLVADVDGDGRGEVLMGSGGYLLHAFQRDGDEAAGFPKFTGGWVFSQPAVGDLDGDGRRELVTVTREGYLFAWKLSDAEAGGEASAAPATRSTTK